MLKPGGHLLAFGGTRTYHRLGCAIEDAGFEIRDSCLDVNGHPVHDCHNPDCDPLLGVPGAAWLYGSGFPKSLDVSKAIDKAAGADRPDVRHPGFGPFAAGSPRCSGCGKTKGSQSGNCRCVDNKAPPVTEPAAAWQGWGTALKPAFEPIVIARKPLAATVAANVLAHGTGALNINGCRVPHTDEADLAGSLAKNPGRDEVFTSDVYGAGRPQQSVNTAGRWPPNVVLDEQAAAELDRQSGDRPAGRTPGLRNGLGWGSTSQGTAGESIEWGSGGASRYFPTFRYEPKAGSGERPAGDDGTAHPTVKPLELVRWLVRLVTPPSGLVLDPFLGSGTTAEACLLEGARCVGMEQKAAYLPLIAARLAKPMQPSLFG